MTNPELDYDPIVATRASELFQMRHWSRAWKQVAKKRRDEANRQRELLRRMLDALEGRGSISHKEYVELKRQVREELKDA